ncbi:heavy-metal-associated domain-containing protein [Haloparvum sedimenti]|uniref:heavy-metal-associated domain-containing protein n=1 Tax=Haloparvum sedimenti TaxID=1678448 RepID=UPI00071E8BBE|nr:heavy metal-associated domain-containing protein [Haloparvum sedimenti]
MTTIDVDGMACTGCETTVEDALAEVSGVESAKADHESGTVRVEGEADPDAVAAAIDEAGYEPER